MLDVADLSASYSGIRALRGVTLRVDAGEMVALVGPNGAGKSTLLNCLSGVVKPRSGSITFEGEDIAALAPWSISRRGLLQVPEGRRVFADMSVLDNLQAGLGALAGRPSRFSLATIFDLFPVLAERRAQMAGSLSGGQQQMLAIGRALMGAPRLLLLDEPSLGLAPIVVRQVFDALKRLRQEGLTILLVEQNAKQALDASDRAYILEQGRIVREADSRALIDDPDVAAHYLGKGGELATQA